MNLFQDTVKPVENDYFVVLSGGSRVYCKIWMSAAESPAQRSPAVLMLHGFPGLEQNQDMAPALQRGGFASVFFNYRGVWGGYGDYSFSHLVEDVHAVLAYLTEHAEEYRIDPARIYLLGHSMGGFAALNAIAEGAKVRGAVLMAPCDLGYKFAEKPEEFQKLMDNKKNGYFRLSHETAMEEDTAANYARWRFTALPERIPADMPLHFIGGKQDMATPPAEHILPLYASLRDRGSPTSYTEIDDGHGFASHRIALTELVYEKLCAMEAR